MNVNLKVMLNLSAFMAFICIAGAADQSSDTLNAREPLPSDRIQFANVGEAQTNRLLLRDCFMVADNAVDDIRFLIVDTLRLPQLEYRILQALYTDKGILFEMRSKEDVRLILDKTSILEKKGCVLKTTHKTFIDVTVK